MKRLALIAVVAACGGGRPRPTEAIDNAGGGDAGIPPPLFAALFVDGRSFNYTIETAFNDQRGRVRETARTTCRVQGMQNFARAIAARLVCDVPADLQTTPDGIWVATAAGIWRLEAFPLDDASISALDSKAMVLAAQPVETSQDALDAAFEAGGESWSVERDSDVWCSIHKFGDGSGNSFCFAPSKGLVRAATLFPGEETRDIVYALDQ